MRIDEIWQYEITQYDPVTRKGGFFVEYMNIFLKIKQEASSPPAECIVGVAGDDAVDDAAIERFIASYEEAEGFHLDKHALKSNPSLRLLAKLALNCFWGKFSQRENLTRTMIVSSRA